MNWNIFGEAVLGVLVAVIGGVVTLLSTRSNNRAKLVTDAANRALEQSKQHLEKSRVDGEAYDRAQRLNQDSVDDLTEAAKWQRQELVSLRQEITALKVQLTAKETREAEMAATAHTLRGEVDDLKMKLERVKRLLVAHRIPVPDDV